MTRLLEQPAHCITVAGQQLPLIITRNLRAKRLVLRFDAKQQAAKMTLPARLSIKLAVEFAQSRENWLLQQMQKTRRVALMPGALVPLWGAPRLLSHVPGRGVAQLMADTLMIRGDGSFFSRRAKDFIRQETRRQMQDIAQAAAEKLGVKYAGLTLRETSSRWGSCTARGELSLNWRLAFAPREVMEYVVQHEVAHILHHNHSALFWQAVAFLCPDYERHERWLSKQGFTVWQYD